MKRFLLLSLLFVCVSIQAQFYPVPVYSASSKQTPQGGEEATYAIDGNLNTMYHNDWSSNGIPDELNFTLYANAQSIKQIVYSPRQSGLNGVWTKVDVYYSKKSQPDNFLPLVSGLIWQDDNNDKTINLNQAITDVAVVRFAVNAGHGNFSSCAEMKFYSEVQYTGDAKDCIVPVNELKTANSDVKVNVIANGSFASSYQGGENIEKSFDNDLNTLYHSSWSYTLFPVTLNYHFDGNTVIDYLKQTARQDWNDNGRFGKVSIFYNTTTDNNFKKLMDYDFGFSSSPTIVKFPSSIIPLNIQIVVQNGKNNFASCAEMEFYATDKSNDSLIPLGIFADDIYSKLLSGVTQTQINDIPSQFYKSIAQCLFDGTYDSRYRVQKYQVYKSTDQISQELKVWGYDYLENPTGIVFKNGERVVLFVKGQPVDKSVPLYLSVKNFDQGWGGTTKYYPIKNGMNIIDVDTDGLGYINYYNSDLTLPDVEVNIVNGTINGYFDSRKLNNQSWPELLQKTTYPRMDVIGEYAHLVYNRNVLKTGTPYDGARLIAKYDEVVKYERLLMGLFKYNKSPKNHQLAYSDYNTGGWFAGGSGINLEPSEQAVANPDQLGYWGIGHEFGHLNQVVDWVGTGEITNNIYSAWVQYKMEFDSKYNRQDADWNYLPGRPDELGGRINGSIQGTTVDKKHFELCDADYSFTPFWQLELYYQLAGACHNAPELSFDYPGDYSGVDYARWFGTVCESVRNENIGYSNGEKLLNFVKYTCDAVQEDLSDFFVNAGFLRPINQDIDDYGVGHLEVTQAQIDETILYLKKYDKPVSPVMLYISSFSMPIYKQKIPLSGQAGVGITLNNTSLIIDNSKWTGAVAFEAYDNSKNLMHVAIRGTNDLSLKTSTIYYPSNVSAVYAVGYDGKRILVYPVPESPNNLSYVSPNVFTKNSTITNLNPTISGGTVTGYSITPSLPAGLSFDTATGIISGTPTAISSMATYTVTAANSGGSTSFGLVITVNDIAPSNLSYPSPNVFTKNSVIQDLNPSISGGTVTGYSITPSLPVGLTFDTATGIISGTPIAVSPMETYTVTATNSGGSTSFELVITVNDIVPSNLSYTSPNVFTKNSVIQDLNPSISGGTVTGYSITPSLPAGLVFDTATGIISGTPTAISSMATYTVTAANSGGSTSFGVVITVNDIAPSNLSYPSPNVFTKNSVIQDLNPSISGGTVNGYRITPSLPAGLSFDTATGIVSGTPTAISSMATYTVTATNSGGDASFDFLITVEDNLGRDHLEINKMSIYPNPIRNGEDLHIVFDENQGIWNLRINSFDGKQVFECKGGLDEIENLTNSMINDLSQGVYVLTLQNQENKDYRVKLVKK